MDDDIAELLERETLYHANGEAAAITEDAADEIRRLRAVAEQAGEESKKLRTALESWDRYARTYQTETHAQWDACVRKTTEALGPNADVTGLAPKGDKS